MDCEDGGQIQARCSTVLYFSRVSYLKMNLKLYWGNERIEAEPPEYFSAFFVHHGNRFSPCCRTAVFSIAHHFAGKKASVLRNLNELILRNGKCTMN